MMRNFLLLFFIFVGFGLNAQTTAALEFVNPQVIDAGSGAYKYQVTLKVTATGNPASFGIGSHNFKFNFPQSILSCPTYSVPTTTTGGTGNVTSPKIISQAYPSTTFSLPTVTGVNCATGLASVNLVYNGAANSNSFPITSTGVEVVVLEWDIISGQIAEVTNSGNALSRLTWRITGANPKVAIVKDDKLTPVAVTTSPSLIPLPIELTKFTGKANGEVNTLRWEVASQSNVSHFEVERSADGVNNFRAVTENVIAAGTTNLKMTYSADDKAPISMGYYRLVSVDKDGTKDYSKVITIDRRNKKFAVVEVTPNPTTDAIRVNFDVKTKGEVTVSLTDALGRVVMTQNQTAVAGNNNLSLDMSSLATGTYFLSLSDGVNTTVERVVKQ